MGKPQRDRRPHGQRVGRRRVDLERPFGDGRPVPGRASDIAADSTDPDTAVVVYAGFCGATCAAGNRTRHVFRTTNGGTNWTDISGTDGGGSNLPDLPLHSVVIDETTTPHSIIVSSDAGVSISEDPGGDPAGAR